MCEKNSKNIKYSVPAVENTFRILQLLSRKRFRECTLTEIAKALSLNPATCYRILNYLESTQAIRYVADRKKYTLGPFLVVLGERAKEHLDYISIIEPYLEDLTNEFGFTSALVNKIGEDKLTFVSKVEKDYGVKISIGRNFSITDGSFGMCFLAYENKKKRQKILRKGNGLKSFSLREIELLEEKYRTVKENGFSVVNGEYINGISGISSPIFNGSNKVEMVIALFGVSGQLNTEEFHSIGLKVKGIADEISTRLFGSIEF